MYSVCSVCSVWAVCSVYSEGWGGLLCPILLTAYLINCLFCESYLINCLSVGKVQDLIAFIKFLLANHGFFALANYYRLVILLANHLRIMCFRANNYRVLRAICCRLVVLLANPLRIMYFRANSYRVLADFSCFFNEFRTFLLEKHYFYRFFVPN